MKNQDVYENINPYENSTLSKKYQVTKIFDTISDVYDMVNKILFFGLHSIWRKKVVKLLTDKKPIKILDIATGTGDLAIDLTKTNARKIVGADISKEMLKIARNKVNSRNLNGIIEIQLGDAEKLNFQDNYFDAITCSFGVRNFENLHQGLSELLRVLKPGGQLVILETAVPKYFPLKQGYYLYSHLIIPMLGKIISKDKLAYEYLSDSAGIFPHGEKFNAILKQSGFTSVKDTPQTLGIVSIYSAIKPLDN